MNDLKFALRQLLKNLAVTAVAVLAFVLGAEAQTPETNGFRHV